MGVGPKLKPNNVLLRFLFKIIIQIRRYVVLDPGLTDSNDLAII